MKRIITIAALGLCLTGCQSSIDRQFAKVCNDPQTDDPEALAGLRNACQHRSDLSDDQKREIVSAYDRVKQVKAQIMSGEIR